MIVTCFYCGIQCQGSGTKDHFYVPRSQGGILRKTNMVYACRACNQAKGDLSFQDFKKTSYYKANCESGRWKGLALVNSNFKAD